MGLSLMRNGSSNVICNSTLTIWTNPDSPMLSHVDSYPDNKPITTPTPGTSPGKYNQPRPASLLVTLTCFHLHQLGCLQPRTRAITHTCALMNPFLLVGHFGKGTAVPLRPRTPPFTHALQYSNPSRGSTSHIWLHGGPPERGHLLALTIS